MRTPRLDPLYVANEGKLVAVCPQRDAERLVAAMRAHPLGREAAQIGEITEDPHRFVQMQPRSAECAWWTGLPANNCRGSVGPRRRCARKRHCIQNQRLCV